MKLKGQHTDLTFFANKYSKEIMMKKDIHPDYKVCQVTCACGNAFETKSNVESMRIDICSACHPFFTGEQKIVDAAGRVEKFKARYAKK